MPKYKEAVTLGLESLKFFVKYDDSGAASPSKAAVKPTDIYNSRPLPYIIGDEPLGACDGLPLVSALTAHASALAPTGSRAFLETADAGLSGECEHEGEEADTAEELAIRRGSESDEELSQDR